MFPVGSSTSPDTGPSSGAEGHFSQWPNNTAPQSQHHLKSPGNEKYPKENFQTFLTN